MDFDVHTLARRVPSGIAPRVFSRGDMPRKPKVHRPHGQSTERRRKKEYDQWRGTAHERGYNARWRKVRAEFLSRRPLCVACEAEGRVELATDLDHIIPHRGDQKLFWDNKNLQGLCKSHHSLKTATEDSAFAHRG